MYSGRSQNSFGVVLCLSILIGCFDISRSGSDISDKDIMKKITKKCIAEYTVTCLKLDVLTLLEKLDLKTNIYLTSGISLIRIPSADEKVTELPRELAVNLAQDNYTDDTSLDIHLFHKISNFLRSINLSFPLVNDFFIEKVGRVLGGGSIEDELEQVNNGLRKFKTRWLRWIISIAYALSFGLLAGLVSKSLVLSLIALGLSVFVRFGNRNFPFGNGGAMRNNYEIIAHPVPQVHHVNTHSSEVKYEDDINPSSSHPGVTYVYPRTMPHIEKVLAFHHLANLHKNLYSDKNGDVLAYKGYITETSGN